MIDSVLTNYNIKFIKEQLDHEKITTSKLSYKIYNNKIPEPLHKFWFSVPCIKYCNNYKDYKTIRFLMNDKEKKINNLINFIKNLGDTLIEIFNPLFPDISIDYPWKISDQFPCIFNFFTNSETIFLDSESNNLEFNSLSTLDTFSIIFDISNIKIFITNLNDIDIYSLKINLSLILIKQEKKKDIKNYNFINDDENYKFNNQSSNLDSNTYISKQMNKFNQLPFLNELTSGINKNTFDFKNIEKTETCNNVMHINTDQLIRIKNRLKKVENNKFDIIKKDNISVEELSNIKNTLKKVENNKFNIIKKDNINGNEEISSIKSVYLDKKNSLKKVNTCEKTLLTHLKLKKKKKIKNKKNHLEIEIDLDHELDRELEKDLEKQLKNNI